MHTGPTFRLLLSIPSIGVTPLHILSVSSTCWQGCALATLAWLLATSTPGSYLGSNNLPFISYNVYMVQYVRLQLSMPKTGTAGFCHLTMHTPIAYSIVNQLLHIINVHFVSPFEIIIINYYYLHNLHTRNNKINKTLLTRDDQ